MRNLLKNTRAALLVASALSLAAMLPASAQQAVQQSPTHLDSAGVVGTSATSAATITITPPSGLSFYLTGLDISNCAGASAVTAAGVTSLTTTNMGGLAYTIGSGVAAGLCQPVISPPIGPGGLKAAAPGAVTFVLPTFATNQTLRVNVYGYYAN